MKPLPPLARAILTAVRPDLDTRSRPGDPALPLSAPARVYLASLAEGSRATMKQSLDALARTVDERFDAGSFPWGRLRREHTVLMREELMKRIDGRDKTAPIEFSTANKMLTALRGVLKEAWRLGFMTQEEYSHASDIENVKGYRLPTGRALGEDELEQLFEACDTTTLNGARNAALVALLAAGGLRRAEAASLSIEDVTEADVTKMFESIEAMVEEIHEEGKRNKGKGTRR